ncbi:hypothetical protein SUGI_0325320 [Cryptomeria japonica]|uniref:protein DETOXIFICATION 30 n=1 Tax=Cryptomeria japonica TaxID=3369 RepID=UPI002408D142|nr:protein DETOXIFICATION 30 [Cryptomeria japonica]GLJ18376.1 hypothetical protein SUGI_0325320 [Cryptomeria japonica]
MEQHSPLLHRLENGNLQDDNDIPTITNCKEASKEWWKESKKLWILAGPAIFISLCQQSFLATILTFAGQLGTLQLAAVSIANTVVAGFSFGVMLGMGNAVETVCGQAFGTGKLDMLGLCLQRSLVILNTTALLLTVTYAFATPILKAVGQTDEIAEAAGKFAVWTIPQLFAFAMNYPLARFLQSQGKLFVMSAISGAALIVHVIFSWLLMLKLGWGLVGAAIMLNFSWWIVVLGQIAYIFSGTCGGAWTGFSWSAFHNLGGLLRLSLSSAVMMSADFMYMMALLLMAGHLKNAEVATDSVAICINLVFWIYMIYLGFNIAIGVRVSNELGAGHPRAAKLAAIVASCTSFVIGLMFMMVILITRNVFPMAFTTSSVVAKAVSKLAIFLAVAVILNNVQLLLSGVAIGAGWQTFVACVNIVCYYVLGVPLAILLGYKFDLGTKGMWGGMLCGSALQTAVLCIITIRANWSREAMRAESRIKTWGGGFTHQSST